MCHQGDVWLAEVFSRYDSYSACKEASTRLALGRLRNQLAGHRAAPGRRGAMVSASSAHTAHDLNKLVVGGERGLPQVLYSGVATVITATITSTSTDCDLTGKLTYTPYFQADPSSTLTTPDDIERALQTTPNKMFVRPALLEFALRREEEEVVMEYYY